jgi:hypothetical protein
MDKNDKHSITGGVFGNQREEFAVRSANPRTGFDFEDVQPLIGTYVDINDFIVATAIGSSVGPTVTVNVRILAIDGQIHPLKFQLPIPGGEAIVTSRLQLLEGFLLSATAQYSSGFAANNWCWVELALTRAPFTTADKYMQLWQGYAYLNNAQGYPESLPQRPTDGTGTLRVLGPTTPAAGADFTFSLAAQERMRFVSFRGQLVTSAVAGNRSVSIVCDDSANIFAESVSNFAHAPSITNTYNAADSLPYVNVPFNLRTQQPIGSNMWLPKTGRIRTVTAGIDVADQWSNVTILVQYFCDIS